MKAIIENSFLKDHMRGLGGMPESVRKFVSCLEPEGDLKLITSLASSLKAAI